MNERRDSQCIPVTSEGAEGIEARLLREKEMPITQLQRVSIVKEVARRRRRLGVDLWKEVIRREHRARKI